MNLFFRVHTDGNFNSIESSLHVIHNRSITTTQHGCFAVPMVHRRRTNQHKDGGIIDVSRRFCLSYNSASIVNPGNAPWNCECLLGVRGRMLPPAFRGWDILSPISEPCHSRSAAEVSEFLTYPNSHPNHDFDGISSRNPTISFTR